MDSSEKRKPGRPKGSKDKPRPPGAPPRGRPKKSPEVSEHSESEGELKLYPVLSISPELYGVYEVAC